ncbi:MAG TPA: hypothetical protein VNX47_10530 [Nevskia sp.]|nr:hypothetical protein [Nevskia sp.]
MKLRFSARGEDSGAVVHLGVTEDLRFGGLVRKRGQALCRADLPNLEPLPVQVLHDRKCCPACVDAMARIRSRRRVDLPPASGLTAGDLIRELARERESRKPPRPRRRATSFDGGPLE